MTLNSKARAVADVGAGLILATVEVAAPIERVFRALTDPAELPKWWGDPAVYQTTVMIADLRVGGRWRSEGKGADGHEFHVEGEYTVVEPPRRVAFTWRPSWDDTPDTLVTYNLEPIDGGTRVTMRHTGFTAASAESCRNHGNGWSRVLDWMTGFVAPPEPVAAWFVKLLPPRPSFAFDMDADERAVMLAHGGYWRERMNAGQVIVFGPVNDPAGPFGLGVLRAKDAAELEAFQAGDPAIQSGRGFRYESYPMLSAVTLA
jgi:uncharacterized protein YndB with AHSA1/START domain